MIFQKYHGAGNDFLIADNREGSLQLSPARIERLCNRRTGIGADGVILLEPSALAAYRMVYFNSDGSGGMMCGNGGRCLAAFADSLGYKDLRFEAADGLHDATILSRREGEVIVRLGMRDVTQVERLDADTFFLDTGTRHYVRFVGDPDAVDVVTEGRKVRYDPRFAPLGTNANFVGRRGGQIIVRTYEKGVEDETLACGTGLVASALAAYLHGEAPQEREGDWVAYGLRARIAGLTVDFRVSGEGFADIYLTGPAACVGTVIVE